MIFLKFIVRTIFDKSSKKSEFSRAADRIPRIFVRSVRELPLRSIPENRATGVRRRRSSRLRRGEMPARRRVSRIRICFLSSIAKLVSTFRIFDFVLDTSPRQCSNKFDITLAYSYL